MSQDSNTLTQPSGYSGVTSSHHQFTGNLIEDMNNNGNVYEYNTILENGNVSSSSEVDLGIVREEVVETGTIMSAEADVTNGFVKNGSSLPYVFKTSETGKKDKILPFCALCNKKFVCVTTMKRHLVTHTGEKPFSCNVCGKQYTQKGNLRVHERTHRGERPFECNICHLTFYRKEPMQKHQWRQHAIVHFKSRPTNQKTVQSGLVTINNNNNTPNIGSEGVLYNSLVEQIKYGDNGGILQNENLFENKPSMLNTSSLTPVNNANETGHGNIVTQIPTGEVAGSLFSMNQPEIISSDKDLTADIKVSKDIDAYPMENANDFEEKNKYDTVNINHGGDSTQLDNYEFGKNNLLSNMQSNKTIEEIKTTPLNISSQKLKPIKLKMKFTQAYMQEVVDEREREERDNMHTEGRDFPCSTNDLSPPTDNNSHEMLTDIGELPLVQTDPIPAIENKESVECQCKSCGSKCLVTDPFNFHCGTCNTKYTSLPIHMIADPLQCIGCLQIFEDKSALKGHCASVQDKERPFRCCLCGYEFRQKAHLQKHQWRIHRRKLEPDTKVKEAEAILHEVHDMMTSSSIGETTLTIQQIIDRGVEREIKRDNSAVSPSSNQPTGNPLDLSPNKMYGTANSINQWVRQVETARTPLIPDISIQKVSEMKVPGTTNIYPQDHRKPLHVDSLTVSSKDYNRTNILNKNIKMSLTPALHTFAIKSKPLTLEVQTPNNKPVWKSNQIADNPLLNQISPPIPEQINMVTPNMSSSNSTPETDRSAKRARTDPQLHSWTYNQKDYQQPENLSLSSYVEDQTYPTDLSKSSTQHNESVFQQPVSPLNLSTNNFKSDKSEFGQPSYSDRFIGKSELNRIRGQDERSGI